VYRLHATLQKFFVWVELAEFGSVVERNVAVGALFELVDFAGVERLGVDVDADGALIVFGEIENLVDGFERIDVDGIGGVHFVDVCGDESTGAGVTGGGMAVFDAEILYLETADGRGHPAVLIAMIVDAGELADFPADGHKFEELVFEVEIAGVAALGEKKIFFERVGADVILDDEGLDVFEGEIAGGDGGEIFDPVGDGELGGGEIVGHRKPPRNYTARRKAVASGGWREKTSFSAIIRWENKSRDGIVGKIARRVAGMAGGDWGAGIPRGSDLSGAVSREEF